MRDQERKERIQEQIQDIIDGMSGTHVIPEPQLERLQEQLNELFSHSTVDPRVDGLIVRMNVVEVEIQNHAAQIATLTTNLTSVSNTVSQLTDAVNGNSNAILALRNSLTSLSSSVDAMEARVTGIEGIIATMNNTLNYHEGRLNTQQNSISQLAQQMDNIDNDVVQLSARLTLLGNTVDGHTQSISNLQSSVSTLSSRLSTAETNIGNISSRVGQNTSSISQLTNRLDNLNSDDIAFEPGSSGMQSTDVENAIIEAYNHGGSSGPVSADDVSFDPSDTDLSSTNVEDVVKEVNDKTVDLETSVSELNTKFIACTNITQQCFLNVADYTSNNTRIILYGALCIIAVNFYGANDNIQRTVFRLPSGISFLFPTSIYIQNDVKNLYMEFTTNALMTNGCSDHWVRDYVVVPVQFS